MEQPRWSAPPSWPPQSPAEAPPYAYVDASGPDPLQPAHQGGGGGNAPAGQQQPLDPWETTRTDPWSLSSTGLSSTGLSSRGSPAAPATRVAWLKVIAVGVTCLVLGVTLGALLGGGVLRAGSADRTAQGLLADGSFSSTEPVLRKNSHSAGTEGAAVVTNTSDKPVELAALTYTLFRGDQIVAVVHTFAQDMKAGEKQTVDLYGTEPYVADVDRITFQVDLEFAPKAGG